ncbi:hypothetical protein M9194_04695 [Vibrio sp. S4M6]|uniref:3-oxoacyl-ACP synthase III family protein n=1 Tax=Vibrio sinus TaxID=2946865 RepID=UPI00202A0DA7|nr:3-oxoacyl-[acyl-carrier-protein] synthase III C-terminal domain-containing protein [Vibrio sinus]MCL9780735.1 hypothetical protein [Vibrio sinus]
MKASFLPCKVNVLAASHQFPEQKLNNTQLIEALTTLSGTKPAKLASKIAGYLGVESRHFSRDINQVTSPPNPSNSTLCAQVIEKLFKQSSVSAEQLDYLIGHTTTPDTQLPANVAWVADRLNYQGAFMELRQACTGFASALQIALPRISLLGKPIAIVGSETGSVYFNYQPEFIDQSQLVNYMQMGDGAGGVLLSSDIHGRGLGVISDCFTGQIGVGKKPGLELDAGSLSLYTQNSPARFHHRATQVRQYGAALFTHSVQALAEKGHKLDDFDYILPHQATGHIDTLLSQALNTNPSKIINHARTWGNLGSAAIWCSFAELINSGQLSSGQRVAILGAEATKYMYGGFIYTHH